ncbi:hypothetical protein NVV95_03250 [Herbiconiux sp. CPCC 205716]|uniref:Lipoprotein n=1 Tax=Herbiconiux gentiana TaxID=2970912 RepID=A0ABT2GBJ2_9MICO|nr:hypothetical protein [Herbiconiux gentiana]MCS5713568.1 hypothetical protein [Herbiconiux gentiana]
MNRRALPLVLAVAALTLTACASTPTISEQDASALADLAAVAGPTSNVDPATITSTECWLPSDHLIDDDSVSSTTFKVLCRAHYTDASGDRYQDATCVGDLAAHPALDHCYRWAPYTGEPAFDDFPAVPAG